MTTTYRPEYVPATRDIHDTFLDEITSLGGTVIDAYDDGDRLFARAVLPVDTEVRPGDRVNAGVALRAAGPEILVHPYTFRQVCTNGAIITHSFQSRQIERTLVTDVIVPKFGSVAALADLRRAVGECASREAFSMAADEMRSASDNRADLSLQLMSALVRLPQHMISYALREIFPRFASGGDQSAFGLMNAVTSAARDARDPEIRWKLEELGATVPARLGLPAASIPGRSHAMSA